MKPGQNRPAGPAARPPTAPFYLVGPTGAGKSSIALALAERCGAEIINADAYQLYEGLEIITAKPGAADLARCPHHLYGVVPTHENIDAAKYEKLGRGSISSVGGRGSLPLVVGGSGLYVKALTHGMSPLPPSEPSLRAELEARPDEELVAEFESLDPEGAENTNLKNRRYVIRALEICLLGGRPMSEQKRAWKSARPSYRGILIQRERAELYERINARTHTMVAAGLLDEIRSLGSLSETAEKAIGIGDVRCHLRGEIDLPTCIDRIQQATRRYAKRQINWFRREPGFTSVCINSSDDADSAVEQILKLFPDL
ncbi:MAG: tRNA (adenosine(37)-N6)-dimethylallyltransferase MiaA [Verrucomicrobiales bacterium]